jgi:hypothetical protein
MTPFNAREKLKQLGPQAASLFRVARRQKNSTLGSRDTGIKERD